VASPADVSRQLLRFRTRQQHAKVKRPEKLVFTDPVLTFNHFLVHDRNLTRRTAEAYKSQLGPKFQSFFKRCFFHLNSSCDCLRFEISHSGAMKPGSFFGSS
jgi:hypothetical protein